MSKNELVVLENNKICIYDLDDRAEWSVGRPTKDNDPEIKLYSPSVSRKHGQFQNIEGIWFYLDGNRKNGTTHNSKCVKTGIGGRIKPVILEDGDTLVFGRSSESRITEKTAWAVFLTKGFDGCRAVDTKNMRNLTFTDGQDVTMLKNPAVGTVIRQDKGLGIYMGDISYVLGNMTVKEQGA